MGELSERRNQTAERLAKLRNKLTHTETIAASKACVYATGSLGRGEASIHSDLDLFIVTKVYFDKDKKLQRSLTRLDTIRIKANLIDVTRELRFPEFSGDGKWLTDYSVRELTDTLGTPEDDAVNTFTARLLLLLESKPLVEDAVYSEILREVIAEYWRDYEDHKSNFMPAFLANDILRLWRTFCVNYEASREDIPEQKKAKAKIKNYKLKHSRLLTCYSALLYLLTVFKEKNTVSPEDALSMISLTPTQRLEWLREHSMALASKDTIDKLLKKYEEFLAATKVPESNLIEQFMDKEKAGRYMGAAYDFGDLVFEVLSVIGQKDRFFRLLVV